MSHLLPDPGNYPVDDAIFLIGAQNLFDVESNSVDAGQNRLDVESKQLNTRFLASLLGLLVY
ncbi:MAG: hypothetical protein KZQ73_13195 [Candidatus Thiodiazotropha sp. (ex Semelilucina semeliformis)]|nr:hypothetical protein [Candidatus Thiodiazotropha sp. (ex Semelilucina semeliformis)]